MQAEALTPWGSANVDPSQFRRIDRVCDAFEAELLAGRRPAIEAHLPLAPAQDRRRLRAELPRRQEHSRPGASDSGAAPARAIREPAALSPAPLPEGAAGVQPPSDERVTRVLPPPAVAALPEQVGRY